MESLLCASKFDEAEAILRKRIAVSCHALVEMCLQHRSDAAARHRHDLVSRSTTSSLRGPFNSLKVVAMHPLTFQPRSNSGNACAQCKVVHSGAVRPTTVTQLPAQLQQPRSQLPCVIRQSIARFKPINHRIALHQQRPRQHASTNCRPGLVAIQDGGNPRVSASGACRWYWCL